MLYITLKLFYVFRIYGLDLNLREHKKYVKQKPYILELYKFVWT